MQSRCFYPHIVSALLLVGYCALIFAGIKLFGLGSQEQALIGSNPIHVLLQFHPHALRYMIVWPVITLAQWTQVDMNLAFSFYVLLITYGLCYLLQKILQLLLLAPGAKHPLNPLWYRVSFLALWLLILLAMNGRAISEFFGIAAILYAQMMLLQNERHEGEYSRWFIWWQFIGLMFTSVSTGTFTVAFFSIVMFMLSHTIMALVHRRPLSKSYMITSALFLLAFMPFELQYLVKNMCFFSKELEHTFVCRMLNVPGLGDEARLLMDYPIDPKYDMDGTVGKMLRHGPAYQLIAWGVHPYIALAVFWLVFGSGWIVMVLSYGIQSRALTRIEKTRPLFATIGIAMSIGIFGHKSLLMMLPALMMLAAYYYLKQPGSGNHSA